MKIKSIITMNNILSNTIYEIKKRISDFPINWVIIGSVGTMLQGINIKPKDIDILTDIEGFDWFKDNFTNNVSKNFEYSTLEKSRSFFGSLEINGITIEIMAELENYFNNFWELHKGLTLKKNIELRDTKVPVLSLSYEQYICEQLEREKKANQIENFIKNII